ncbi:MAG: DNA endonuclease SmrA [Idiomarina sp.]|nr:DNA endonuclease SmrA [Idiomarina sp.]
MNNDDTTIFRELMQDVKPLQADTIVPPSHGVEPTVAHELRRQAATAIERRDPGHGLTDEVREWVDPDGIIGWRRDGVQDGVFRQLKRGNYEPQASLNMHQMRVKEARTEVARFIEDCHRYGIRCATLIHGKGKRTPERPALLKSLCNQWLPELEPVLAFHTAQRGHGGAGATYVLIRKNQEQKLLSREQNRKRL